MACLVRVVKTSSPRSPGASGRPESGSTTSTRKWSLLTCRPAWLVMQSVDARRDQEEATAGTAPTRQDVFPLAVDNLTAAILRTPKEACCDYRPTTPPQPASARSICGVGSRRALESAGVAKRVSLSGRRRPAGGLRLAVLHLSSDAPSTPATTPGTATSAPAAPEPVPKGPVRLGSPGS